MPGEFALKNRKIGEIATKATLSHKNIQQGQFRTVNRNIPSVMNIYVMHVVSRCTRPPLFPQLKRSIAM